MCVCVCIYTIKVVCNELSAYWGEVEAGLGRGGGGVVVYPLVFDVFPGIALSSIHNYSDDFKCYWSSFPDYAHFVVRSPN